MFCLHYIFLPRINASIEAFRDVWNRHPMQSEGGRSPQQQWISGMAQFPGHIMASSPVINFMHNGREVVCFLFTCILILASLELIGMHLYHVVKMTSR